MADMMKLKAGEYLIREKEQSTHMYFVHAGIFKVLKIKSNDTEQEIGTITVGEIIGEMSFLDKKPRSASVRAFSDCEVIVIPTEKFEKVLKEMPIWFRALLTTLIERLRQANNRLRV